MSTVPRRVPAASTPLVLLVLVTMLLTMLPPWTARAEEGGVQHLLISEVVTGGASASDELIELYNPTAVSLPLEGLELLYVTATGATVSRRTAWGVGAPSVPPAHHILVANELGSYAAIADTTYGGGMASTGGSVALRIQGASLAIDALGWGTAASTWMEGTAAAAPPAGSSLERLPGGEAGSTRDSDNNASDFALRAAPDPQNLGSAPSPDPAASPQPTSSATPSPTVAATPGATPGATPVPTPSPTNSVTITSVADARAAVDGTEVTIEATALAPSDFTDGGGYVADATGGIAVMVDGDAYARGDRLRLNGIVSDRFSQRTLRVDAAGVERLGTAGEPAPVPISTGAIAEGSEGRLARISGTIASGATTLTSGVAFDVDDGSGPIRVLVSQATGIDTGAWSRGATVTVTGIVGQRDSSGTGALGYRLLPRDAADVGALTSSPEPTASPSETSAPSASATPAPVGVMSVADARRAGKNSRVRVRGVITMPTGLLDAGTAVVQDGSGAIMLRLGEEAGSVVLGALVEVDGVRSTKSGMETLRVTAPPRHLGAGSEPAPRAVASGAAGERDEAMLVAVRGGLVASARTSPTGTVTFEIDDGSGPLRVSVSAAVGYDDTALVRGTWVEVRGVLGQETTGAQPTRGYRVWPRHSADIRVTASPSGSAADGPSGGTDGGSPTGPEHPAAGDLGSVGSGVGESGLRVGATLVAGPWAEIGTGGLLWDGRRLVALEAAAAPRVEAVLGSGRPPVAVELGGLVAVGTEIAGVPVVRLGSSTDAIVPGTEAVHPPATGLPGEADAPRWTSIVGRLVRGPQDHRLATPAGDVVVDHACEQGSLPSGAIVSAVGIASPRRPQVLVVGCGGFSSAPHLGRGSGIGLAAPAAAEPRRHGEDRVPGVADGPPVLPAALVALGALGLVGGAATSRRLAEDPPPDDEPAETADAESEPAPPSDGAPPSLTLVPLPREGRS